ncbi:MAG: hypothetical protein ACKO37_05550 [Vampirovibrionales bacterium]
MMPNTKDQELLHAILATGEYVETNDLKSIRNAFVHATRQVTVTFGRHYMDKKDWQFETWVKRVQALSAAHLDLLEYVDRIIAKEDKKQD